MRDLDQWSTSRLLTTAARLVEQAWLERLIHLGVTHAGVIALGVLAEQGVMTQAHLAQWVRVQAQTMGKTLSHLEARGYVLREPDELDRRAQAVSISAVGRQVLDDAGDIERTLVTGGSLVSEELRRHLMAVIAELGEPRWRRDPASGEGGPVAEGPTGAGGSGPSASCPSL